MVGEWTGESCGRNHAGVVCNGRSSVIMAKGIGRGASHTSSSEATVPLVDKGGRA